MGPPHARLKPASPPLAQSAAVPRSSPPAWPSSTRGTQSTEATVTAGSRAPRTGRVGMATRVGRDPAGTGVAVLARPSQRVEKLGTSSFSPRLRGAADGAEVAGRGKGPSDTAAL